MKILNTTWRILAVLVLAGAGLLALNCDLFGPGEWDIMLYFHNDTATQSTFYWQHGSNEGWRAPLTVAADAIDSVKTTTIGKSKMTWFSLQAVQNGNTTGPSHIVNVDWSLNKAARGRVGRHGLHVYHDSPLEDEEHAPASAGCRTTNRSGRLSAEPARNVCRRGFVPGATGREVGLH